MGEQYAQPDVEIVDYQIYCLDKKIINPATGKPLLLRGTQIQNLEPNNYFVCIGAAQTFGRFCQKPFPTLLEEKLGLPVLNLGSGGATSSFFLKDNETLLTYINNAKFAIIEVMSARRESNSLFINHGTETFTKVSDGTKIQCGAAYQELLDRQDIKTVKKIVTETRNNFIDNYKKLLNGITVPKILFWFSSRPPRYQEKYQKVSQLFGQFPHLVNQQTIRQVRKYSDRYVECVSVRGKPHILKSRFTGQPTEVRDSWVEVRKQDSYYPSPEMHVDAANALEPVCKQYVSSVARRKWLKLPLLFSKTH